MLSDLWPVLRAMEDSRNLNCLRFDLINDDVWQRSECKLASSGHAAARPPEIGKVFQARIRRRLFERRGRLLQGCRAGSTRRFAPSLRLRALTSGLPSGAQEPFKTLAHLLMREGMAVLQRVLTTTNRINEAALLVEIPGHDLLHQLIGIASLLSRGPRKLCFEFGREKDFHGDKGTA